MPAIRVKDGSQRVERTAVEATKCRVICYEAIDGGHSSFQSWYYAAPGPVIYVRFGVLRIACMVREGECSVKSGCFDFAIAPLNMTAKAVTPSAVEGSRGWIGVNPYESHRRMFGELETFRLR